MRLKRRRKSSYSLEHYIKVLVCLSIPIIAISIIVSLFSIATTRKQNISYISNTISLFQTNTASKVSAVERFVRWTVIHEPLVKTIRDTTDYYERITAINTLRTRVSDNQYATGKEFQYFLYLSDKDMFINSSSINLSYSDFLLVKINFLKMIEDKETTSKWKTMDINGTCYFYYMITYYDNTFISLVSAEDMLKPLERVKLGSKGYMFMTDTSGKQIASTRKTAIAETNTSSLFLNHLAFKNSLGKLPFALHIYVDNWFYERIIVIQVILIFIAFFVALTLLLFMLYMQNKVIKPILNFSQSLSVINEGTNLLDLQDSNIIELEQASQQFKNLMHEIVKLKINLYEQELEKKRIQIGYMQQQIRPHFYLNCLTTIHSMAQTQNYKEIESMALFTTKYLRYLFQTNTDFIRIEHEINHINDYLSIQTLRYGSAFSYECTIEPGMEQVLIPPLVLMTFIENTIKHCISLTITLKISLEISKTMEEGNEYCKIILKDTGPGFESDMLAMLNDLRPLNGENGTRIGINNTIKRLSFLYDEDFVLHFSNNEDLGAKIELIIPVNV